MGWRYFTITMGGLTLLMWATRFFLFTIFESPKYLMGKGRDEEAVRIVHEVARRNKKTSPLTIEDLKACESVGEGQSAVNTSNAAAIKRQLQKINLDHVRALFSNKRLAFSTAMIMAVWGFSTSMLLFSLMQVLIHEQSAWPIRFTTLTSHTLSPQGAPSLVTVRRTSPIAIL